MRHHEPIFVKSALISAHLHFATEVAKDISLTSKNARVVTVRAGQKAAGFIAITDFIEELSKVTIARSTAINTIAIKVSRIATEVERATKAQKDFNRVLSLASDADFIDSILEAKLNTDQAINASQQSFIELLRELEKELEDSHKQVRTANMLVSTSKIEATQSGEYRKSFEVIAVTLEEAANAIRHELSEAEKLLQEATEQLNESY